jgi:hypothetical protein
MRALLIAAAVTAIGRVGEYAAYGIGYTAAETTNAGETC